MKTLSCIPLSLLVLCLAGRVDAADLVWTNLAGGSWNNAANWNPNQVPGPADHAVIDQPGDYTVGLNINQTVAAFTLGGTSGSST